MRTRETKCLARFYSGIRNMLTVDSARHCHLSPQNVFLMVRKDESINFSRCFPINTFTSPGEELFSPPLSAFLSIISPHRFSSTCRTVSVVFKVHFSLPSYSITSTILTCHLCKDLSPKYSLILRHWGLRHQHINLGVT